MIGLVMGSKEGGNRLEILDNMEILEPVEANSSSPIYSPYFQPHNQPLFQASSPHSPRLRVWKSQLSNLCQSVKSVVAFPLRSLR